METINILMQIFFDFWLLVVPTAAVTWFAVTFIPVRETELAGVYFKITPLYEIVWYTGLYALITTSVTVVLFSVLGCLFLRCTAASPGLYPSRGLKAALLMYRLKDDEPDPAPVDLDHHRAIPARTRRRALLSRVGASECDVMFNLVPELASADSQVFWSNGGFTNMLDYGAEHFKLRQLDMPRELLQQ